MRIDEHGRWVSDDGAYVWDEAAQTWQPSAPHPTGSAGFTAAVDAASPATDGIAVESTGGFSVVSLHHDPATPRDPTASSVADDLPMAGTAWPQSVQVGRWDAGSWPGADVAAGGQADAGGRAPLGGDGQIGTDLSVAGVPDSDTGSWDIARTPDPVVGAWLAGGTGGVDILSNSDARAGADMPTDLGPGGQQPGGQQPGGQQPGGQQPGGQQPGGQQPGGQEMAWSPVRFGLDDQVAAAPGWEPAERDRDEHPAADGVGDVGPRSRIPPAGARAQGRRRRSSARARPTRFNPPSGEADGNAGRLPPGVTSLPRPALFTGAAVLALLLGLGGWLVFGRDGTNTAIKVPVKVTASPSVGSPRRYSEPVRAAYLDECVQVSGGLRTYCTCTLEKLEATYPEDRYLAFNNNVNSADSTRVVREIADQCASAG
ncbi:hypothetical protein [Frankia sp. Cr1]|uniref:hypothetical protein n=1 Tax=Frankia sp. Cr1 TaxID=3073931 RepID=UPI002AD34C84|nr:hypothetical protein [Frankia sp. Cr1]